METIGDKIKGLRKSKGLSLMELANKLNVSDTAISKIETGKTKSITIELGKGICNELGVSFNELFEIKTDTPDIEKMQTELAYLNSVLKEKNDRIEEKEKIIHLQEQVNRNFKNAFLEAFIKISATETNQLMKIFENTSTMSPERRTELARVFIVQSANFLDQMVSWGCFTEIEIESFMKSNEKFLNNGFQQLRQNLTDNHDE